MVAPAAATKKTKPLPKFNIGSNYQVIQSLGEGAYGTVVSAVHKPTGKQVAIKRILPFEHSLFCIRTLRELKLLRDFSEECDNENIIAILDIVKPPSLDDFKEIYFVQELMQTDLHRVIRTQQLSDDHCQYFVYQILRALKTIHSADLVHRDLKPANLLINSNCDLKVCDFGLARSVRTSSTAGAGDKAGLLTEYVATRWYRAPEIMLSFSRYTKAVDVWAVGCILAELLSSKPLFPGRDYHHQLTLILDVLGTPSLDEYYSITSRRSREYIRALPIRKRRSFAALFPEASEDALDFLTKTLTFDPKNRATVEELLEHPYLTAYHDAEDEPSCPSLEPDYFEFDTRKEDLRVGELKELLYEEIMSFTPAI